MLIPAGRARVETCPWAELVLDAQDAGRKYINVASALLEKIRGEIREPLGETAGPSRVCDFTNKRGLHARAWRAFVRLLKVC